jgi:hypothetical protein
MDFGTVLIVVAVVAVVVAALSYRGAGQIYAQLGRSGGIDSERTPRSGDLREEVRQLVVARNERRVRQGQEPLDVEAEVDRELRALGG